MMTEKLPATAENSPDVFDPTCRTLSSVAYDEDVLPLLGTKLHGPLREIEELYRSDFTASVVTLVEEITADKK